MHSSSSHAPPPVRAILTLAKSASNFFCSADASCLRSAPCAGASRMSSATTTPSFDLTHLAAPSRAARGYWIFFPFRCSRFSTYRERKIPFCDGFFVFDEMAIWRWLFAALVGALFGNTELRQKRVRLVGLGCM